MKWVGGWACVDESHVTAMTSSSPTTAGTCAAWPPPNLADPLDMERRMELARNARAAAVAEAYGADAGSSWPWAELAGHINKGSQAKTRECFLKALEGDVPLPALIRLIVADPLRFHKDAHGKLRRDETGPRARISAASDLVLQAAGRFHHEVDFDILRHMKLTYGVDGIPVGMVHQSAAYDGGLWGVMACALSVIYSQPYSRFPQFVEGVLRRYGAGDPMHCIPFAWYASVGCSSSFIEYVLDAVPAAPDADGHPATRITPSLVPRMLRGLRVLANSITRMAMMPKSTGSDNNARTLELVSGRRLVTCRIVREVALRVGGTPCLHTDPDVAPLVFTLVHACIEACNAAIALCSPHDFPSDDPLLAALRTAAEDLLRLSEQMYPDQTVRTARLLEATKQRESALSSLKRGTAAVIVCGPGNSCNELALRILLKERFSQLAPVSDDLVGMSVMMTVCTFILDHHHMAVAPQLPALPEWLVTPYFFSDDPLDPYDLCGMSVYVVMLIGQGMPWVSLCASWFADDNGNHLPLSHTAGEMLKFGCSLILGSYKDIPLRAPIMTFARERIAATPSTVSKGARDVEAKIAASLARFAALDTRGSFLAAVSGVAKARAALGFRYSNPGPHGLLNVPTTSSLLPYPTATGADAICAEAKRVCWSPLIIAYTSQMAGMAEYGKFSDTKGKPEISEHRWNNAMSLYMHLLRLPSPIDMVGKIAAASVYDAVHVLLVGQGSQYLRGFLLLSALSLARAPAALDVIAAGSTRMLRRENVFTRIMFAHMSFGRFLFGAAVVATGIINVELVRSMFSTQFFATFFAMDSEFAVVLSENSSSIVEWVAVFADVYERTLPLVVDRAKEVALRISVIYSLTQAIGLECGAAAKKSAANRSAARHIVSMWAATVRQYYTLFVTSLVPRDANVAKTKEYIAIANSAIVAAGIVSQEELDVMCKPTPSSIPYYYRMDSTDFLSCARCRVPGTNALSMRMRVCGGCRATYYCDEACQRAHWATHRPDCKLIAATASDHDLSGRPLTLMTRFALFSSFMAGVSLDENPTSIATNALGRFSTC